MSLHCYYMALTAPRSNRRLQLPRQLLPRQPPPDNPRHHAQEPRAVVAVPLVEAEALFIEVAEQVPRHHADVGSVEHALQEAPGILDPVRVDPAVDVGFRVVDRFVNVVRVQALIGRQRIGEHCRTGLDMRVGGKTGRDSIDMRTSIESRPVFCPRFLSACVGSRRKVNDIARCSMAALYDSVDSVWKTLTSGFHRSSGLPFIMESTVHCPDCNRELTITPRLADALVRCSCGKRFTAGNAAPPTMPPRPWQRPPALLTMAIFVALGIGVTALVAFLDHLGYVPRLTQMLDRRPQANFQAPVPPAPVVAIKEMNDPAKAKPRPDVKPPPPLEPLKEVDLKVTPGQAVLARQANEKAWLAELRKTRPDHPNGAVMILPHEKAGAWSMAFAADAPLMATAHANGVTLWNLQTGEALRTLPAEVGGGLFNAPLVRLSPDGSFIAIQRDNHRLMVMPANDPAAAKRIKTDRRFRELAFTADGKRLVALLLDHTDNPGIDLKMWEVGTWQELPVRVAFPAGRPSTMVKLAPDGSRVAFQETLQPAVVFDVETGTATKLKLQDLETAATFAFSGDARQLIVTPGKWKAKRITPTFERIDLASGTVESFYVTADYFTETQLTPDGRYVSFETLGKGKDDYLTRFIDVATGQERWSAHGSRPDIVFSPGAVLAAFTWGGDVHLHELDGLVHPRWADLAPAIAAARDADHAVELWAGKVRVRLAASTSVGELDKLIASLPIINSLSIRPDFALSPELLAPLVHLAELEELELNVPAFAEGALQTLQKLKNIRRLTLRTNSIPDAALINLESLTNLHKLTLDRAKVSAPALDRLRKALPRATVVEIGEKN